MKLIVGILSNALAFYLLSYIVPGVEIGGYQDILVTAVVWGIIAMFIRPIIKILTFPINIVTLGLFSFVINAGLLLLTDKIVDGFSISSFGTALIAAIVLTIISSFLNALVRE
jgi:putative membrane protein